ncbi:Iron-regulated ABC transporter permease protein SufD [Nitrosomonas cryotolerans]|uniref:Iron-regulated ABC transporter permease protein SufD n=1 Tax=Nitrosomonas cryotolerans ATCC 49181 TaxID=1131553 RepID=A0A1N6ID43_9PROT|nr:Fe-S cluster assembly protein SufD [Nitrosomonas cryotolerans]SFP60728.1 Iron-regulated ABC transporter permease protein SufD [Nitrosomonas cryotolerans]SIO29927.1 Iron-regulated ABC transporter permease protein SufD [Nitrosomonas cryotolerans ATCC 49181]
MNETVSSGYLKSLLKTLPELSTGPLPWLNQLRSQAIDRVGMLRMPTTRDEEWRFTDISPLIKLPFQPAQITSQLQSADIESFYLEEATTRLVFIDGHYAPELSNVPDKSNIIAGNLSEIALTHTDIIAAHLGQYVEFQDNVFAAFNTAFLLDGAVIIIPHDTSVTTPVHLLFIATQKEVTSYSRCLVIGETGSNATIIEDYVALQESTYVTNTVTEISLAARAQVNHIRVQRDSNQAFHFANAAVSLAHTSHYQSVNITLGARISRHNLNVRLTDEASTCAIDGLALIADQQLADTHTDIDHLKPHGTSRQLHKCIVDGAAHAVFNGRIMVHPNAQRTNSSQSSRNLLLTRKAHVDTKPQLEIFADDVKCAHGATVGQLDNEEIFYLKSRGLSEIAARNLLTYAFGAEIIDRISIASLRNQLEQTVLEQTQSSKL